MSRIRFRLRDSVNAMRGVAGAPALALNTALNAAAFTHAQDMAAREESDHIGSDGSSPIERAQRMGYRGTVLGEVTAETYGAERDTVTAWMMRADTRAVLIDPRGRELGIGLFQQESGKIWWCLLVGDGGRAG